MLLLNAHSKEISALEAIWFKYLNQNSDLFCSTFFILETSKRNGVSHGDIRPGNFLSYDSGKIKIIYQWIIEMNQTCNKISLNGKGSPSLCTILVERLKKKSLSTYPWLI